LWIAQGLFKESGKTIGISQQDGHFESKPDCVTVQIANSVRKRSCTSSNDPICLNLYARRDDCSGDIDPFIFHEISDIGFREIFVEVDNY
jgi:hypothetical protein